MTSARRPAVREFVEAYRRVRAAEGFADGDPAYAAALPFRDLSGRQRAVWRVRAVHYLVMRLCLQAVAEGSRVLDLGAGNGWMARRLARRFRVTALDVDGGPAALGALRGTPVSCVRGELDRLPFADASFDVVVAAASLHHAADVGDVQREVARILRAGGLFIVADSPVYTDAIARGRAARRTESYYREQGEPLLAACYRGLVRSELDGPGLFRFLTLVPGVSLRASLAALRHREPGGARFPVLLGWRRS
jgi:ubiquinone/menaquinone biosynthesis C-methylase UbiE